MSRLYTTLVIGGVEIPMRAMDGDKYIQTYSRRDGVGKIPMDDGGLDVYTLELKDERAYFLETTISGGGFLPAPLWGLKPGVIHEVQCAEWLLVTHPTNPLNPVITVPWDFRTGGLYGPTGYALVEQNGFGVLVETPVVVVGRQATLTPVAGAINYELRAYPVFSGVLEMGGGGNPMASGDRRWSVTIRETG